MVTFIIETLMERGRGVVPVSTKIKDNKVINKIVRMLDPVN